jgi:ABC-type polysaccharide/polyol phosphate transport system ATPase subunit
VSSEQIDASARPALAALGVTKTFKIPEERSHTLKERALHPLRRSRHEQFQALKDITFSVAPGEFFGIVGRNGSGKSTLLKCLAGIYRTDSGKIWANGRMSTFIELGVGFNPDLAAYDNVALNGVMLGLSSREAKARYERVIEFAELEEFQELKLKNYSSGMHVRLAFSVAIQVDADILVIDEVLAVGDASFQQKCFDVFNRMRDEGRTIVFVTHDMGAVTRFCHRAMLLERGEMVTIGNPDDIADRYLELSFGRDVDYEDFEVATPRMGDGTARVSEVWIGDDRAERRTIAPQSEALTLNVLVKFNVVATTTDDHEESGGFQEGELAVFSFSMHNMLAPGRYHPIVTITHRGDGLDVIDRFTREMSFVVTGLSASGGMIEIPVETNVSRWGVLPPDFVQPARVGSTARGPAAAGIGPADPRAARAR